MNKYKSKRTKKVNGRIVPKTTSAVLYVLHFQDFSERMNSRRQAKSKCVAVKSARNGRISDKFCVNHHSAVGKALAGDKRNYFIFVLELEFSERRDLVKSLQIGKIFRPIIG